MWQSDRDVMLERRRSFFSQRAVVFDLVQARTSDFGRPEKTRDQLFERGRCPFWEVDLAVDDSGLEVL